MSFYNYPNISVINGTTDYINFINTGISNWMAPAFLFIIWFVSYGVSLGIGVKKALMVSSFITFVISIYLIRMNLINPIITFGLLVLTIVGAILSKSENSL